MGQCLRVNHAGEVGANYIYDGQIRFISKEVVPLIQHMKEQEQVHLKTFNELLSITDTRPSALLPIWKVGGLILGMSTAIIGKEMAMLCTEAVETTIGKHYNDQLRELNLLEQEVEEDVKPFIKDLQKTISKFRDDELEHKDIAEQNESSKAPLYSYASQIIKAGCSVAVEIAKRV